MKSEKLLTTNSHEWTQMRQRVGVAVVSDRRTASRGSGTQGGLLQRTFVNLRNLWINQEENASRFGLFVLVRD